MSRRPKRIPRYTAAKVEAGHAYLFHFPFDIFVESGLTDVQHSFVNQTSIDLYPPFFNGREQVNPPQVELSSIPWKPGTLRPDFDRVRPKDIAVQSPLGAAANALRVDFRPDRGTEFANRVVSQFLGLARWWTGQWWIGRDRFATVGHLRNGFPINEAGERLAGISGFINVYGGFGIERPLTLVRFQNIRGNITNGRTIPLSWDAFFDAIYFHVNTQYRRAVLEAAIACEAKIGEQVERICMRDGISKSQQKKALSSDDFTVQLTRGVFELTSRDFAVEHPNLTRSLKALRTVRGNVAHGGLPLIPGEQGVRHVTHEDLVSMLRASLTLFNWLEGL